MEGFSFNGVHCSEFGIHYIPDAVDRVPIMPEYKQIENTVTGRHGGYYYGNQVEPLEFE